MGLYDSVIFRCPGCGEEIEFQSKSGRCELSRFDADDVYVPMAIAADLHENTAVCAGCGELLRARYVVAPDVPMRIEILADADPDDEEVS